MPKSISDHSKMHVATLLQHEGKQHRIGAGLIGATETSVTFTHDKSSKYEMYARLGNTANHQELQAILMNLHYAEAATVFGSGMSAFTATSLALLKAGDHVLVQKNCYGGTHQLFTLLIAKLGIEVVFAPLSEWPKFAKENTRLAVFESISNPFCIPADIASTTKWAREKKITTLCDNTFASPANCTPCTLGVDLVLESATKYLNGHSDVTAGMVAGSALLVEKVQSIAKFMGGFLPTSQSTQLLRGLKTFDLRMQRHNSNGQHFAAAMRQNAKVEKVYYGPEGINPVLDSSIEKQFPNGFGGMCTVRFKPEVDTAVLLNRLKLITNVPSLGGTESTVTLPTETTNSWQSDSEKLSLGIDRQVLRFSIGLEDIRDIVSDLVQAIAGK